VLKLCQDRRGEQVELTYVGNRAMVVYEPAAQRSGVRFLRPAEIGVARLRQLRLSHRPTTEAGDLVKMSILVNGEPVDALSIIVHRARAEARGRAMCEKLKELIPPHMFQIRSRRRSAARSSRAKPCAPAQGRHRQMLRRRHHPQAQAAGQAEGRQEEDAPVRQGRHPAGVRALRCRFYSPAARRWTLISFPPP
jgi:hypothetical protein